MGNQVLPVAEGQYGDLGTGHALLDDHLGALPCRTLSAIMARTASGLPSTLYYDDAPLPRARLSALTTMGPFPSPDTHRRGRPSLGGKYVTGTK